MSIRQNGYFLGMLEDVHDMLYDMKLEAANEFDDQAERAVEEAMRALDKVF